MTFLGWLSDPFQWLSDLQLGDEKVTLNHLVFFYLLLFLLPLNTSRNAMVWNILSLLFKFGLSTSQAQATKIHKTSRFLKRNSKLRKKMIQPLWKRRKIVLMDEIPNNHLGWMTPCEYWDKLPTNQPTHPTSTGEYRISEPSNSTKPLFFF